MNGEEKKSTRAGHQVTLVGIGVNALLIVCKFIAGIVGNSQAMVADAVHSVSDFLTDALVLLGLRFGRKEEDPDHPFGHGRIETLSTTIVGLILIGIALYLGIKAFWNIYEHREYHPTWLAMAGAILSICVKESLYHYTVHVGRRIKSPLIIANAWHHRSDALSSIAVMLGVGAAQINPDWHFLDGFAAAIVSFLIIRVGFRILWQCLRELADAAPAQEELDKIMDYAKVVPGVVDIHKMRVRSSGGLYQMELHIEVDGMLTVTEGHRIAKEVETRVINEIEEVTRVTIHVDPEREK